MTVHEVEDITAQRRRRVILLAIGLLVHFSAQAGNEIKETTKLPAEAKQIKKVLAGPVIPTIVPKKRKLSPHWRNDTCLECHTGAPNIKNKRLKTRNMQALCQRCHNKPEKHEFIHPSGIKPNKEMVARMPKAYRRSIQQQKGNITCHTCHELPMSCLSERKREKGRNPFFLRGGPYKSRTSMCFYCHDDTQYQRLNAHKQLDKKGQHRKEVCQLCHKEVEGLAEANSIKDVSFYLKGNLAKICVGCHPNKPHPGGSFTFFSGKGGSPNHLVVPPRDIRIRMLKMERKNGIILPVDPDTGKIFCATCHNPHQRGVIKQAAAAKGADEKKRLRFQGICVNCHDK